MQSSQVTQHWNCQSFTQQDTSHPTLACPGSRPLLVLPGLVGRNSRSLPGIPELCLARLLTPDTHTGTCRHSCPLTGAEEDTKIPKGLCISCTSINSERQRPWRGLASRPPRGTARGLGFRHKNAVECSCVGLPRAVFPNSKCLLPTNSPQIAKSQRIPTANPRDWGSRAGKWTLETMGNRTPLAQAGQVAQGRPSYLFDHTFVNLIEEFLELIGQHRTAFIGEHLL